MAYYQFEAIHPFRGGITFMDAVIKIVQKKSKNKGERVSLMLFLLLKFF